MPCWPAARWRSPRRRPRDARSPNEETRMKILLTALVLFALTPQETKTGPTFTKDIAPIVFANCASCHRPGEVAPFALLSYEDVKKRGKQIVEAMTTKQMPPWKPEVGH